MTWRALSVSPCRKGRPGGAKALQKKKDAADKKVATAAQSSEGPASTGADSAESLVMGLLTSAAAGSGSGMNREAGGLLRTRTRPRLNFFLLLRAYV